MGLHAAPSYGVRVERTSGNVRQMELSSASGPAQGIRAIKGATVGIGFLR